MALLRVESFDHWATADAVKKGWILGGGVYGGVTAGIGRTGVAGLRTLQAGWVPSAAGTLQINNNGRTGVVGFAMKVAALPSVDISIVSVREGGSNHIVFGLAPTGVLRVLRNTTLLAASGTAPILVATWQYIELAWNLHDTTGSYEVRVNGVTVLSASSVDTQNGGTGIWAALVWWGVSTSASITADIDDVYVGDDNVFRGDHRIMAVVASAGNGAKTDWTPSTGTDHGALVDDVAPNITDYVRGGSVGLIDTFNFEALGVPGAVKAVQTATYMKAEVAGVRTVAPAFRIGGVDYAAAGKMLGSDWEYAVQVHPTSPATAVPWTVAEIDAAEFGLKVVG